MEHARRLVPGAVVVASDHRAYREMSERVFDVLGVFTPTVEPISVDEAFVDIAGLWRHYEHPQAVGAAMRDAIRLATSLPASVGIATSKLLAKMASRDAKPDGLRIVAAGTELAYLHPKPVRSLWGVGEATYARLEELGIATVGDIAAYPRETLVRRLGEAVGRTLWELAHADDQRRVADSAAAARSISVEETYETDLVDLAAMERELLVCADRLAGRLRRGGVVAHTVSLKARYPDFTTVTRSETRRAPMVTSNELFTVACRLLRRTEAQSRGVRLLGIGGEGLVSAAEPRQLDLDGDLWEQIDDAIARIRDRFGADAVGRARLVEPGSQGPDQGSSR